MLVSCWSVKGGSGCSTVAAALALHAADRGGGLAVDLRADLVGLLGIVQPAVGLGSWSMAYPDVATDALARIEVELRDGVGLLPGGPEQIAPELPSAVLTGLLARDPRVVVVDCGTDERWRYGVVPHSDRSVLVMNPCYVSCARAACGPTPTSVVVVRAPWHAIGDREVETVVGAPVVASIPLDRAVATATDAGLFVARVPRVVRRAMEGALR